MAKSTPKSTPKSTAKSPTRSTPKSKSKPKTKPKAKPEARPKARATAAAALRVQYGALPYRETAAHGLEILLLTSRRTQRWIVPKGWPIKGLKQAEAAAREAYEEAGVRGAIRRKPIGAYVYDKLLDETGVTVPCEVKLFALRVTRQEKHWPEQAQRETRWLPAATAAETAGDEGLRTLIANFVPKKTKPRKSKPRK